MPLDTVAPAAWRRKYLYALLATGLAVLITIGVFAENGWFPTDINGQKTGWFGKMLPKNAASSWNPFAAPLPTPTPQLAREYLYTPSGRLLAVEDANASAVPPADLAIWRPSTGGWWVLKGSADGSNTSSYTAVSWGLSSDKEAPGDYDGDGKTDFAVFRPSEGKWYVMYSATGTTAAIQFGQSGDRVAQADYDGDGKTDCAFFRPSDTTWYILRSSTQSFYGVQFGLSGDTPAPADYDGDGRADVAVWRDSTHTFYSVDSSTGSLRTASFGSSGSTPVSADYS
jgi:hypothetical protein